MLSFQSSKIIPIPEIKKALNDASNKIDMSFEYPDPSGSEILRNQILTCHPHWHGDVLITNSATEATYLALSQLKNKTLALNVPSYFGILRQIKELKINVIEWKTIEDLKNIEYFDGILLTSNFTPPTGESFSCEDKDVIAKLSNQFDAIVIEDNAYELLSYSSKPLTSVRANKIIHINSFSKILSPNLRMGFMIADSDIMKNIRSLKITLNLSSSPIPQKIISDVLKDESLIKKWSHELYERAVIFKDEFEKKFDLEFPIFDGGAFVKLPVDNEISLNEFIKFCKNNNLLVDDNCNQYSDKTSRQYLRLHLGAIDKKDIPLAMKILYEGVNSCRLSVKYK